MTTRNDWLHGDVTSAEERDLFDAGELTECEYEFGPHDEHDDCNRMIAEMSSDAILDQLLWDQEAADREAEADMLGRPLFPNEY
jgi:hypothetical protein